MNKYKLTVFLTGLLLLSGMTFFACRKTEHANHAAEQKVQKKYRCPMHPTYISDKPGDCPICGMRLEPIEPETHEHAQLEKQSQAAITISPERQQLIGVKTEMVTERKLEKIVRASARVAYDLELYNAITEYKEAYRAADSMKTSSVPEMQDRAKALLNASALKLRQLGLSQSQIDDLDSAYQNPNNLLLSEKGGSVWVYAQIYEYESDLIKPGQTMEVQSPAMPGKKFWGTVKSIDSILNSETRSLRVRAEVPNPQDLLKPEMYLDAKIHVVLGVKLAVPESAVIYTGERQLVFVDLGQGKFEPRETVLGQEAEGYYEVISGVLKEEKVVTSANFLIDSESKLKAAISGMGHQHD